MNSTLRKLHNSICVLYEVLKWPLCTCLLGCDRMLVLSSYFFHSPAVIKKHFNRNTDALQVLLEFCEKERESDPDWCFLFTPASLTTGFSDSYQSRNFQLSVSVLEPNKPQISNTVPVCCLGGESEFSCELQKYAVWRSHLVDQRFDWD